MKPLNLWIPGKPQAKGRARAFLTKFGRIGMYAHKETANYESVMRFTAQQAMAQQGWKVTDKPVIVRMVAQFKPPQSWPKWKHSLVASHDIAATVKPDLDNIIKNLDGLNGVVWVDDQQIVEIQAVKVYDQVEGLGIIISETAQRTAQGKRETQ